MALRYKHFFQLLCVLLLGASAFAQFDTAEVLGTVHDESGSVVSKALVTLANQATGIQSQIASDDNGNYTFFDVKPGRYQITAEAPGFTKFSTRDVVVNVNARQRVDATLKVGSVSETVEVTGVASLLDTDSSEKGQIVSAEQITDLPLNGRNYSDLALLATNVHTSPISTAPITATPREGSFIVNGLRSTYNNFLLDGVDNNAYSTSNQGFSNEVAQPSPDAIAEFKLITADYSAEYGRVGGAVINTTMRSGTNQIHGTVYEFLRNSVLNASGYVFTQPFQKPTFQRNQFGGTVGGPFVKDKIFFFADYEGFRQVTHTPNFDTIPNMNDRAGILPVTVVDPRTGTVYAAGTTVPMIPFAQKVLNQLPAVAPGTARANDLGILIGTRDFSDKFDAKIDGKISNTMTGFLRFSQRKDNQLFDPDIPGPSGGGGNGHIRVLDQSAAIGYTWTVTPKSVLDARFSLTHLTGGKFPVFLGTQSLFAQYGIPGLPTTANITGGLNTQSVTGFNSFGRQSTNPQFQNPTNFGPKANYSWTLGRHSFKTGGEIDYIRTEVMDINPVYGIQGYGGQFSKPTCAKLGQPAGCIIPADSTATTSYNLADFFFGLPNSVQLSNYLVGNYRQHVYAAYFQDDFRVNSKLSLNLGLRWEFATPRWERDNNLSNFDPVTNTMIRASGGDLYSRTLVHPDYKNFGPRVGFAYNVASKTVVRGGYGISYVHLNRLGSADELGINGPQVVFGIITQSNPSSPNFLTTQQGFPASLDDPASFNPVNANVAYIPANTRWPYVETWFLSAQREIGKNTVLELAYTGNHALRMPILADFNQAVPNLPGQVLSVQARRPDQGFGAITWVDPAGQESYNGLSARLEHRFSSDLYFLNSFTYSKALGNSEQALESPGGYFVANPQNIRNLPGERGPSSYDETLLNTTTFVYQLPFGKGRKFGSEWNGVVDSFLGGWELNTINIAHSGVPIDVVYTPAAANDVTTRLNDFRGVAEMRPNLVGNPYGAGGPNAFLDKTAFAIPPASAPFGNLGRNSLRAPNFWQWDLGINKSFRIPAREGMSLQFRSELFNLLNHTNFGIPTADITSAAFGTIRSTYPARQIQFGLKVVY